MTVPRRELTELYAKYDLHPGLFDIYVEGDFDYDFLNLFLTNSDITNASVFSIDDIELPSDLVRGIGLDEGSNKHRVLTLAHLLDQRYAARNTNQTCLSDPDRDRALGTLRNYHHATYTDYTCLEAYLLCSSTIERFLTFACQLPAATVAEFLGIANTVLPVQFVLRAAVEVLGINRPILGFESGLVNKRNLNSFNGDKYLNSFLAHYALQRSRDAIIEKMQEIQLGLPNDLRHCVQGHDFVSLLFEFVWAKGSLKLQDKEESAVKFGGRLLAMSYIHAQLSAEPLFARIVSSASGNTFMRP